MWSDLRKQVLYSLSNYVNLVIHNLLSEQAIWSHCISCLQLFTDELSRRLAKVMKGLNQKFKMAIRPVFIDPVTNFLDILEYEVNYIAVCLTCWDIVQCGDYSLLSAQQNYDKWETTLIFHLKTLKLNGLNKEVVFSRRWANILLTMLDSYSVIGGLY